MLKIELGDGGQFYRIAASPSVLLALYTALEIAVRSNEAFFVGFEMPHIDSIRAGLFLALRGAYPVIAVPDVRDEELRRQVQTPDLALVQ